MVILALMF